MNRQPQRPQSGAPVIGFGPGGQRRGPGGPMGARMNAEKPKNTRKTLGRLLSYIGRSKITLILLLAIMVFVTVAELAGPFFQARAIDSISIDPETGKLTVDRAQMLSSLSFMGVLCAVAATLTLVQSLLSASLSQRTVYTMRNDLFRKISRLPIQYTDTHRHGDIMSRMTNDVENVSNAVSQSVTSLVSCVMTIVGALAMMLYYSWQMTIIAMITIPLSIFISSKLGKFMRKYFVRQQRLLGALNGQVEETVTSYKTVVAYGKEADAVKSFSDVSSELRDCAVSARVWGSIMGPVMNFVGNLQYVLIAATGGWMVLTGRGGVTVGSIQAMLQYSKNFTRPINMIANQYSSILTALAGAERIFEIMDSADEIDGGKEELNLAVMRGNVEFSDIHFGYIPEKQVLRGLNLSVKPGQKIAIVGATGSGKTTVVNLLTRFYEPSGGRILVDGKDITEISKASLRHSIAIVLQDTVLFSDTIRNNICYGHPNATDEQIRAAAEAAGAAKFINRLPDGYETVLAESGSNLSQGQRQLLAIARAVLADPKILILDEATSNVDTRTEMRIQRAMQKLMENRTSLIIAHRLSTIRDSDMIVVIKDGVVAESGKHEELLAAGGEYAKLYQSQFAGVAT
jgi:ATP-binding cassette subfamily B protein